MSTSPDIDDRLAALSRIEVEDTDALQQHAHRLQDERDRLDEAYSSGDSDHTYAEHRALLRQYDDARNEAFGRLAEARALNRVRASVAEEGWQQGIDRLRQRSNYRPGSPEEAMLDRHLRFLGNDPANAGQSADWFLETAHQMTLDRQHGTAAASPSSPSSPLDQRLGSLTGLALEAALSRLSPEEAEAWLTQ